jgi:DNA-binding NarL/FixJ family response regulator
MKRVVLVEDQVAVRELLATVLRMDDQFEIVAECGDGQTACSTCLELKPDLVILDVMLPGLNGVDVLKRFSRHLKNTRVLVFSGFQNPALVRELLQAGAHGFVEKSARLAELRKGIQTVADGGTYFGPHIAALLREAVVNPRQSNRQELEALTAREREILQLIAESYSTKEIAAKLEVSVKTAENHRTNLMKKLNLHDVASLTRFAIEHGMTNCNITPVTQ